MKSFKKMGRAFALAVVPAAMAIAPTPASAKGPPPPPVAETSDGNCAGAEALFGATATACSGYYFGNVLSNNAGDVLTQEAALTALGVNTSGFNFNNYLNIGLGDTSTKLDFGTMLYGLTIVGIHWGNVPDPHEPPSQGNAHNYTAFIEFNLPVSTDSISILNAHGISGAVLYQTGTPPRGVPEPATWAMMIVGFGAAGVAMRRRKMAVKKLPQLA